MNVLALPAFNDNYIWLLHDGTQAVVVDPGDAGPVRAALSSLRLTLNSILVTHHHADHIGGVDALRPHLHGRVYGPAREAIPQPFDGLQETDVVPVLERTARVLDVPGHTAGHIAYVIESPASPAVLLCGDTLFSAGCGRLFEGTPAQMQSSLDKLMHLPGDTLVYCTHEYTLSNLRFAKAVEPNNPAIDRAVERCAKLRAEGQMTLPSTLAEELRINPFLRCEQPEVIASALQHGANDASRLSVFSALREWKNQFR
jgi:hydroxyacylglutathione hydrolase